MNFDDIMEVAEICGINEEDLAAILYNSIYLYLDEMIIEEAIPKYERFIWELMKIKDRRK